MYKDGADSEPEPLRDDQLLDAVSQRDEKAETIFFARYYRRLTALARKHMGRELRGAEDSSDIVQSVFLSVFKRSRAHQIKLANSESLWALLVAITLNKVRSRGRHHHRQKRDRRRQTQLDDKELLGTGPLPEDAAQLHEEIHRLLEQFNQRRRQIIELWLAGWSVRETADAVPTTMWTVYKTRRAAWEILKATFGPS